MFKCGFTPSERKEKLAGMGGGGGHYILVDLAGGKVTASDGIYEAVEDFLNNGNVVTVNVYSRSENDNKPEIAHCPVTAIRFNTGETDRIDFDCGMAVWIKKDGNHSYYYD